MISSSDSQKCWAINFYKDEDLLAFRKSIWEVIRKSEELRKEMYDMVSQLEALGEESDYLEGFYLIIPLDFETIIKIKYQIHSLLMKAWWVGLLDQNVDSAMNHIVQIIDQSKKMINQKKSDVEQLTKKWLESLDLIGYSEQYSSLLLKILGSLEWILNEIEGLVNGIKKDEISPQTLKE